MKIQNKCAQCGEAFTIDSYELKRGKGKYCSQSCAHKHFDKRKDTPCPICGKIFRKKQAKYCSAECFAERQRRRKGPENKLWKGGGVDIVCKQCGVTFKVKRAVQFNAKFCSRACKGKWNSENARGEGAFNWRGGTSTYQHLLRSRDEYKNWRNQVFERDQYRCTRCGKLGGTIHAHHVLSFSKYPDKRLDINNGTTLCKHCHETHHWHKHGNTSTAVPGSVRI